MPKKHLKIIYYAPNVQGIKHTAKNVFDASPDPPRYGSCCPCPLQTAALGGHQAPAPAAAWLCCCPCYAASGEAIVSSADCTASGPPLSPRFLGDPACMWMGLLKRERNTTWTSLLGIIIWNQIKIQRKCSLLIILKRWLPEQQQMYTVLENFNRLLIDDKGARSPMVTGIRDVKFTPGFKESRSWLVQRGGPVIICRLVFTASG